MSNIVDRISKLYSDVDIATALPKVIRLELSNVCNHHCKYCATTKVASSSNFMDFSTYKRAIDEILRLNIAEVGIFYMGEATLHPEFKLFVDYIKDKCLNLKTFLTTNGTSIVNMKYAILKEIDSLKVSLNTYSKLDNILTVGCDDFDLIVDNIKTMFNYRERIGSKTQLSISAIKRNSIHQEKLLKELKSYADSIYYTPTYNHAGKISNEDFDNQNILTITTLLPSLPCLAMYSLCHIKANGDVTMCRFSVDDNFTIGNILENNLDALWHSKIANDIRLNANEHRNCICNKCINFLQNNV